jgi:anti-sigma B factor antagonist
MVHGYPHHGKITQNNRPLQQSATHWQALSNLAPVELSETRRDDGAIVIAIEGELDLANASALRDAMFQAFETTAEGVWLDFARCTFIDSTGLRVIIEGARRAGEGAGKLGVLNLNEQPQRLFELTSVDRSELIEFA